MKLLTNKQIELIRNDFPLLKSDLIYFNNASTTLKPKQVINQVTSFLKHVAVNDHTQDHALNITAHQLYQNSRQVVAQFINCLASEIAFTSSTTFSINQIAWGLSWSTGDEILLTKNEHAANLLPWIDLALKKSLVIKYLNLNHDGSIDVSHLQSLLNSQVKLITFAIISNVLGSFNDPFIITNIVKKYNEQIIVVLDAAQSVATRLIDVKLWNNDFLVFSAHKILGITGTGVLYGKQVMLDKLDPLLKGGMMSNGINHPHHIQYLPTPTRLEGGTHNVLGAVALSAGINYLTNIGMDKIHHYVTNLKKYAETALLKYLGAKIIIYNTHQPTNLLVFNIKNYASHDVVFYLATKHNICLRSGVHCAIQLHEIIKSEHTIRASFYIYNTKQEIDIMVQALATEDYLAIYD